MGLLKKIDEKAGKIEEFILSYGVIMMALILIGNVISRTLFNNSWKFAEEVGQMLVITITFVGTGYAARKGKHIRMSAVFDAVPKKVQKIIMIITALTTSGAMFYLAYLSYQYTMKVYKIGRVTPALRMPMFIVIAIVTLGFILTGIQYLLIFTLNIKEEDVYIGAEKVSGEYEDPLEHCDS